MVKLLMEHGASPNSKNADNERPLILLCAMGIDYDKFSAVHLEIIRMLLKYGADVNGHSRLNDSSALIEASRMRHLEVVKLLLQEGADIHTVDKHQRSALMLSAAEGRVDIARVLLSHGAHINYRREAFKSNKERHESQEENPNSSDLWETALEAAQVCARDPDDDPWWRCYWKTVLFLESTAVRVRE
ncbi:ankyrin repeat protein [Penicillium capsulatum]|nr:ankyrin repeat protein [Penicillium capsulatum]